MIFTQRFVTMLLGLLFATALTDQTLALYHPGVGRFCSRDPIGYVAGAKADRVRPNPRVSSPTTDEFLNPTACVNTTSPYPSKPPVRIGVGGANPCVGVVIKCANTVTVFHFTQGDDPWGSIDGRDWTGCEAMVCGGSGEHWSNCQADAALDALTCARISIVAVSSTSTCGVLPNGDWYEFHMGGDR